MYILCVSNWSYVGADPFEEMLLGPTYATKKVQIYSSTCVTCHMLPMLHITEPRTPPVPLPSKVLLFVLSLNLLIPQVSYCSRQATLLVITYTQTKTFYFVFRFWIK